MANQRVNRSYQDHAAADRASPRRSWDKQQQPRYHFETARHPMRAGRIASEPIYARRGSDPLVVA